MDDQGSDNPFSFSNFGKSDEGEMLGNVSVNEPELTRRKSTRKKKEQTLVILEDELQPANTAELKENPFSFKNFVKETNLPSDNNENNCTTEVLVKLNDCDLPIVLDDSPNEVDLITPVTSLSYDKLNDYRNEIQERDERIEHLENELIRMKKKETEDTAALEAMVQQVEETLETTTKRALLAEGQVTQMKQEVKTLQGVIKSLQRELSSTRLENTAQVREKAEDLAQKLKIASESAEANLKSLLGGVNQLKEYSNLVASIGSVSEEN